MSTAQHGVGDAPSVGEPLPAVPSVLPVAVRLRIFVYLGGLTILLALADPNGGLMDIPISFFLKNRLHLEAHELAVFRVVAAVPLYFSFLFGLVRDSWNPLGMQDRGLLAVFGTAGILLYLVFAVVPATAATMLLAVILLTIVFLFISSALNGLMATLGQQHAMSGQVAAVWNAFASIPAAAALMLGGHLSQWLEQKDGVGSAHGLFVIGAATTTLVVVYSTLRPRVVFDNVRREHAPRAQPLADLRRLARHRAVWPAMAIWLLWNFAPGSTTPLQYYLQNTLHAQDSVWGTWNAIFAISFIPTFLIFGLLCQRVPLKHLLWVGTIIAVPQFVPLLFIHSPQEALVAAIPIGLMGGISTGAYMSLIIRSCPPGLQGTTMMLSGGLYYVSARFGDVLGTWLYDFYGGFTGCVVSITLTYAMILPVLLLVPRELTARPDGVAQPV